MVRDMPNMRQGDQRSYHDLVFDEEISDLINITYEHYHA